MNLFIVYQVLTSYIENALHFLILHSSGMSDEDSTDLLIFSFFEASVKKIRALTRI